MSIAQNEGRPAVNGTALEVQDSTAAPESTRCVPVLAVPSPVDVSLLEAVAGAGRSLVGGEPS
ncbi:hypothetical protein JOD52_001454 [Brachybacterium muris]|uniref:hypothetical protein n=1 Tax=Brachybacterium muris TaxID=219301 RepID=UPI001959CFB0|nr:hypothetical protein [Brachybacterium muris]MBM7500614.1 hypothetical protein [Brachybacterium muris]